MAQRPKEHVRSAIVAAAAEELAEAGFEGATLAGIASRAGTSIGNLYKYFTSKDELFEAAVPPRIVERLDSMLRRRVEALGVERDVASLAADHPYRQVSEELLRFSVTHRAQVLFLLRRAEGTAYAAFAEDVVRKMSNLAVAYARRAYPGIAMTAPRRRALVRVYRAFVGAIAAILAEETDELALREATTHWTTYHLAGLRAFFEASRGDPAGGR